ncbi:unnamed protein product [Protopolystoma xenopodis]|uniref:Uncharacterized protein n=1 Tax=Protopolystoma xenopodis TaxID=117903 RepID=A0A448X393_9PLAT|nr:unnamed protein product [Protopolystoma xenopodis]
MTTLYQPMGMAPHAPGAICQTAQLICRFGALRRCVDRLTKPKRTHSPPPLTSPSLTEKVPIIVNLILHSNTLTFVLASVGLFYSQHVRRLVAEVGGAGSERDSMYRRPEESFGGDCESGHFCDFAFWENGRKMMS